MERLIEKNYYLHKSARDGYRSYLQAYASHSLKTVFNVNNLDLQKVARAFGFAVPPSVNLSILSVCVWGEGVWGVGVWGEGVGCVLRVCGVCIEGVGCVVTVV